MASAAQIAEQPSPAREPRNRTEFFSSPGKPTAVFSLLLVLLTLLAYNPVTKNSFVSFDDPQYITTNPHVRAGLTWSTVKWAFRSTEQANWHPLTWLSHAFDWQLFHQNPAGHHYVSVLLHAFTAVLLFLFLQAATKFAWRSAMVAALFAVHPVNVESVAWAAERKSVLSMLFFVLMLMAYRWYAQKPGWKRFSLVAIPFAMALMSKPMLVTAPFLLLLLDYWPLGRTDTVSRVRLIVEKLPLLAMSAASSVVTMVAQKAGSAIHTSDFSLSNRIANAIVSYARYLGKAVWPSRLASFYPHTERFPTWEVAMYAVLLIVFTIVVLQQRSRRYLLVGWFWFLGTLAPMIGIVQAGEQAMADRYAYLPFVGLFVAVVWALSDSTPARIKFYLTVAGCGTIVALSAITYKQIGYWKDTRTLWTHTLSITGPNPVAEVSLGAELISEGDVQDAVTHLKAGIAINPRDPFGHLDLGVCEKEEGYVFQALDEYHTALRLTSDDSLRRAAYHNLGAAYRVTKDYPRARSAYEAALRILPNDPVALTGMGVIAIKTGDSDAAANYFSRVVKATPSDVGFLLLAQALAKAGRQQEARAAYEQAQKISENLNATMQAADQMLQE